MRQNIIPLSGLFRVDNLSIVLMTLVAFVAVCIGSFSTRYLKGDRKQGAFFANLVALVLSVFFMVCADHLLLLFISWVASNALLTRMMLHKREWTAARHSSVLALKNFALGSLFLGAALLILYNTGGHTSIRAILETPLPSYHALAASVLLALAAMSQSAVWPFHRWLLSSLNSPTPVSAIMHAGLINGGGFLLVRFAPLLASQPMVLNMLFVAGMATAILGTLWKLMQHDIKRMLACSTMGQMGFMIAQCGLGLFPAAIAHLCWHGLFKAYLFLASGSAAKEERIALDYPPSFTQFVQALGCGILAAVTFALASGKQLLVNDTTAFLMVLAMLAGAQFALPLVRSTRTGRLPLALLATVVAGACYGASVHLVERAFEPFSILPPTLNVLHFIGAILLAASWVTQLFIRPAGRTTPPDWALKKYVQMLNASQPHPKTITAHRNKYTF